jgi:hypothetical protein
MFSYVGYPLGMADADEKLTSADPCDLAEAIAYALRYDGRKRIHQADEYMAKIAAERIVRHLEHARFVVMSTSDRGQRSDAGLNPGRKNPGTGELLNLRAW